MIALLLGSSGSLLAQARETATAVKVGYIYNFLRYVTWPDDAGGVKEPLVIAVLDDRPLAAELARVIADRSSDGQPLMVRRVADVAAAKGAHVVFVSANAERKLAEVTHALSGPVLIISESDKALEQGSVINLVEAGGRIRFEVSLAAAQQRRLNISSRMLAVAINVKTSFWSMWASLQAVGRTWG